MKQLTISVDTKNRELPVFENSDYTNYYVTPSDASLPIPSQARYMEVVSLGEAVYLSVGASDVLTFIPSADTTDGTSPRVITASNGLLFRLSPDETHFSIISTGDVTVSFWR